MQANQRRRTLKKKEATEKYGIATSTVSTIFKN